MGGATAQEFIAETFCEVKCVDPVAKVGYLFLGETAQTFCIFLIKIMSQEAILLPDSNVGFGQSQASPGDQNQKENSPKFVVDWLSLAFPKSTNALF